MNSYLQLHALNCPQTTCALFIFNGRRHGRLHTTGVTIHIVLDHTLAVQTPSIGDSITTCKEQLIPCPARSKQPMAWAISENFHAWVLNILAIRIFGSWLGWLGIALYSLRYSGTSMSRWQNHCYKLWRHAIMSNSRLLAIGLLLGSESKVLALLVLVFIANRRDCSSTSRTVEKMVNLNMNVVPMNIKQLRRRSII